MYYRCFLIIIGTSLLIIGGGIYVHFRNPSDIYFWSLLDGRIVDVFSNVFFFIPFLFGVGNNSLPSLIHVLALSLITSGLSTKTTYSNSIYIPLFWSLINLIFEFVQHRVFTDFFTAMERGEMLPQFVLNYILNGTFDWNDIWYSIVGGGIAVISLRMLITHRTIENTPQIYLIKPVLHLCTTIVFVGGIFSITATSEPHDDFRKKPNADPVYLSYEELRESVDFTEPESIIKAGKIFVKDQFLFINDVNRGVHIFDNSEPTSPKNMGFINIPGNIDIAVKDTVLFADSFIDLIAIDFQNLPEITIMKRVEDVFPYDPYQMIEDLGVYFGNVDDTQGVVIGYSLKGND